MKVAHTTCNEHITEDCSKIAHKEIGEDFAKSQKCALGTFYDSKNPEYSGNDVLS